MTFGAELVVAGIALAALSGVPGLFLPKGRAGERTAAAMLGLGAVLGLSACAVVLATGRTFELELAWTPRALSFRVDALGAFFLVPIFGVSALAAVYGLEYWPEASHPQNGRRLRLAFGLIVAGLATVAAAANALLFLFGWEVMALAAFVAVGTEDHLEPVRKASYLYLVTTRIGTLCLFAMFAVLHAASGGWALAPAPGLTAGQATAVFLLGLVGFGLKAGVMPAHVWLPPAHAAAPSHVSALMSGVLIKIGIYGLLRMLSLLPEQPLWWAQLLLGLGAVSAVLGVAFALSQHDLKRLLAYHSIENIGIIVLGVGVAVLGRATQRPALELLGLSGALFHVWNHGLFKSLLFLSAGSVVHACGTREIDRLGGLARQMPRAAALFLLGAVAISGLPPLNGFASELLVYLGLFGAAQGGAAWAEAAISIGALALVGGLALACFVKVYGAVFLGAPRSGDTAHAHDGSWVMSGPMAALAGACVVLGVAPLLLAHPLETAAAAAGARPGPSLDTLAPLTMVSLAALGLLATTALCGVLLARRLKAGGAARALTWDCGYAAPTARMQYTASSFADTLVDLFGTVLRPHRHLERPPAGVAPAAARFETHVDDTFLEKLFVPLVRFVAWLFGALRWLQPGRVHLYVLYVVLTLLALVWWAKGAAP